MTTAIDPASSPTTAEEIEAVRAEMFAELSLDVLIESGHNPRLHFDATKLQQLTDSIRQKGVVEPLVVRPLVTPMGFYEIVAGARRCRASKAAGLTHVPCVVRQYSDEDVLELVLIENVQRDDLAPLEQARGFKALLDANADKYSVATIATKVGMSPAWVWDRIKLLDLVPEAQALLARERITVGHAIVLSRLKPEHQTKAIDPNVVALWQPDTAVADLMGDGDDADPYAGYTPNSIESLKAWIAKHVRFDVEHAAQAVPLEFEAVAARVEEAKAKPGRGKKVVEITYEYQLHPDARSEQRVYTQQSWARADGSMVHDEWNHTDVVAPVCEHAVLGVVVAGRHYGRAFDVCIAKDVCRVHWAKEIDQREKDRKAREKELTKTGSTVKADTSAAERRQREVEAQQAREAARKAWDALLNAVIADAVDQVKSATKLPPTIGKAIAELDMWSANRTLVERLGKDWHKKPAAAWLVLAVDQPHHPSFDAYVANVAKPLGLNVKRLTAIRDKHQPQTTAASTKKIAAKKAAKGR